MLLEHLSKYLESIEEAVGTLEGAYVERYEEEILTSESCQSKDTDSVSKRTYAGTK